MDARGRATLESTITIAGTPVPLLDRARIYVCGITPYDVTHLGHAATYVWVDVLGRVLRHIGVEPEVCRNVTDVDDVLDAAAARAGTDYDWFASVGQFQFENDMTKLNVRAPQHEPRAHRYITHFVQLAHHLVERAAAYVREGTVYFRGADVPARAGIDRERALALAAELTAVPMTARRTTRSTWRSGTPAAGTGPAGTRPGVGDALAGMPSAWRCRARCSA